MHIDDGGGLLISTRDADAFLIAFNRMVLDNEIRVESVTPADLAYVRLKPDGSVVTESILEEKGKRVIGADELSQRAWQLLTMFLDGFNMPSTGYLSRALPFRESDMDGDYDHLARVLEWSAGGDNGGDGQ